METGWPSRAEEVSGVDIDELEDGGVEAELHGDGVEVLRAGEHDGDLEGTADGLRLR